MEARYPLAICSKRLITTCTRSGTKAAVDSSASVIGDRLANGYTLGVPARQSRWHCDHPLSDLKV